MTLFDKPIHMATPYLRMRRRDAPSIVGPNGSRDTTIFRLMRNNNARGTVEPNVTRCGVVEVAAKLTTITTGMASTDTPR
jgi:ABC-type branched-subunit amino acid transport system ATPase component